MSIKTVSSFSCIVFSLLLFSGCKHELSVSYNPSANHSVSESVGVNVYVENTGSMSGFMCGGSEYKDALYSYVSALDGYADTIRLNYINTSIVPCHDNISAMVNQLNPKSLTQTGGNTGYSDIADMLSNVLKNTTDNTVSIFITDCILALPSGATHDYYINRQIEIKNIIARYLKKHPDLGIEIFRMESKFVGLYYPGAISIDSRRPYYMFVMGNKYQLAKMNKEVPFSQIKHGFKNYYAYTKKSLLDFEMTNKFGVKGKKIPLKNTNRDGMYEINANLQLASTLQQEELLTNIDAFVSDNPSCKVTSVKNTGGDVYSHTATIEIDSKKISSANIAFTLHQPKMPAWIDKADGKPNVPVMKQMDKTVGVRYIIEGISDAFQESIGTFDFNINH